jgi:drug/metabolite transporter superfamily protein YnfA
MAGGASMLHKLTADGATHRQLEWVRDGHAHGGVLILMSILYYLFLDQTSLPNSAKHAASFTLFLGVGAQVGGFILHGFVPTMATIGTNFTLVGAGLLMVAIIVLVFGLLRTRFEVS